MDLTPTSDMSKYVESLRARMLMPYPSIRDALGLGADVELRSTSGVNAAGRGFVRFQVGADTDITIVILPEGMHAVGGTARGIEIPASRLPFQADEPGLHRGVQGKLVSYIEDTIAKRGSSKFSYQVSSDEGTVVFDSVEDLCAKFTATSIEESLSVREALRGQPRLKGLIGPMYNGRIGDVLQIRYESQRVYDNNSR